MLNNPSFLTAICENPEDDTPRLIYADWLEENGQPERAEFIRLQIEAARLPSRSEQRIALKVRAHALLKQHRQTWLQDLPKPVRHGSAVHFERGFVSRLACTVNQFLKVAARVFRVAPVHIVWLSNHDAPALWEELAQCPHLTRVRELCLGRSGIRDAGIAALAASPHLANLKDMHLVGNLLTDVAAKALIASPYLARLGLLDLEQNPLGEASKQALRQHFGERVRLD